MRCRACGTPARPAGRKDGLPLHLCPACGSLSRPAAFDPPARYEDYLPPATLALPPATRDRYREILAGLAARTGGPGRLLDVGAGAGLFLETAREEGWSVLGTELSRAAAARAGRRGLPVRVGNLADLDLPRGAFDAAVSLETVEHVPDPAGFLAGIRDLLRPRGILFLTTPNYGSLSRRWLGREWLAVSRDHLCLLTPRALAGVLAAAGFRPERVTTRTILPPELAKRFRGTPVRRQGFPAEETAALQEAARSRTPLRWLKALANGFLARTGLGDVLTVYAAREAGR